MTTSQMFPGSELFFLNDLWHLVSFQYPALVNYYDHFLLVIIVT